MKIKQTDPHPTFRAYVVGHEGESKGKLINPETGESLGHIVKKWYRSAVENIFEKISLGMNFFHGHNYDNSTAGRNSIGVVVGKTMQTIMDKLSVVAIAYIKPEYKNLPLDVASIEADIKLKKEGDEYLADVDNISGIALGNSNTETPGFAGATLLAQVQEFAEKNIQHFKGKGEEMGEKLTIGDIKEIIKAENLTPTDLFSLGALTEVPDIKDLIADREKEARKGEFIHRKRTDKKFDEEKEAWETKEKELQDQIGKLKPLAIQNQRDQLLSKAIKDRKLDEKESAFITKNISSFNPEDMENIERELDKFLDSQLDNYNELAKDVFGIEKKEEGKAGVAGAGEGKTEGNPFIPSA
jgi:hypothetical protein